MSKKNKIKSDEVETIIGPSVKTEGLLKSNGNIRIQGALKGEIKTSANLYIEEGAQVEAQIKAKNAVISGEVKGDIKIEEALEITEKGRIIGNIAVKSLSVAPNAIFDGQCKMLQGREGEEPHKEEKNLQG